MFNSSNSPDERSDTLELTDGEVLGEYDVLTLTDGDKLGDALAEAVYLAMIFLVAAVEFFLDSVVSTSGSYYLLN